MQLRQAIIALGAAVLGLTLAAPTGLNAQAAYPVRPIKVVVGFPPGQATDVIARLMATKFSESLGQAVVVDNRPGKGGSLGAELVAKSAADGYTLLVSATAPLATNVNLYPNVGYNPATDFAPISLMAWLPFVLIVNPAVPANTMAELIAYAKARPGALSYASSGNGTTAHLTMEMLKRAAGLDILHVPYKGGGEALQALLGGQTQLMFNPASTLAGQDKGGRLRMLAVASRKRVAGLDLPTMDEAGLPGFEASVWFGLFAPAGTPAAVLNRINAEINRALQDRPLRELLEKAGMEVLGGTPDELRQLLISDAARWGAVVKAANVRLE